ncbi:MAG: glycosyltransferase, partial [Phycisphaerales bacterium]|nr:glycosyltransferase [Phycisphaerales bacterium]
MRRDDMRVLHLIDPGSPGGGACTLQLVADATERLTSVHQDVLIFGHREHVALARRCGLTPAGQLCGPKVLPHAGRNGLRRWIAEQEAAAGPFDIIHAWTPRMAILATLAAPAHRRLATLSVGPLSGVHSQLLIQLLKRRPMPLLATSTAVQREYRSMGLPTASLGVLPPAVHARSIEQVSRVDLRERWGIDEETTVIGLMSEPVNWADANVAMNILMRIIVTGRKAKLLLHPTAYRRAEAEWLMRSFDDPNIMIIDDEVAEPWRVVNGLDVALLIGGPLNVMNLDDAASPWSFLTGGGRRLRPMPGIMPLLWAMASGKPVVAEASNAVADIIQDGVNGFLVHAHDINPVCDRILRICDDHTIGHRLGANARKTVDQRFHVSAYAVRLKETYEQLMKNRFHS